MNDAIKMQISAFVDGELPHNEAELLLRRMCQDRELRQQAAEYLAMGRLLRGERSVPGMEQLRGRIAAALDDKALQDDLEVAESAAPRLLRPLAGVAIAATVALAALFGLQQLYSGTEPVRPSGETVATSSEANSYTVPQQGDAQLRQYFLLHSESSADFGGNSINDRLRTVQGAEGLELELQSPEQAAAEAEGEDERDGGAEAETP